MAEYPKVKSVAPVPPKRLRVTFANGAVRIYDCTPLLRSDVFRLLEDEAFFRSVRADEHGYGVIWNDAVDLAESELWLQGTPELDLARGMADSEAGRTVDVDEVRARFGLTQGDEG